MKKVEASFFFKDDTILYVWSDNGEYNNATLDMTFYNNVEAIYELSKCYFLIERNTLILKAC